MNMGPERDAGLLQTEIGASDVAEILRSVFPMGNPEKLSARLLEVFPRRGAKTTQKDLVAFFVRASRSMEFLAEWLFAFCNTQNKEAIDVPEWEELSCLSEEFLGVCPGEKEERCKAQVEGPMNSQAFVSKCLANKRFVRAWKALRLFMG
jgi:hypothetical protein